MVKRRELLLGPFSNGVGHAFGNALPDQGIQFPAAGPSCQEEVVLLRAALGIHRLEKLFGGEGSDDWGVFGEPFV
jgi:hypothetical protein